MSTAQIEEQLNLREAARRRKDYNQADVIRDILKASGVETEDRDRVWRAADGRTGNYLYITADAPAPKVGHSKISMDDVMHRLAVREQAQRVRDYATADRIREEVRDDRTRCHHMLASQLSALI